MEAKDAVKTMITLWPIIYLVACIIQTTLYVVLFLMLIICYNVTNGGYYALLTHAVAQKADQKFLF